MTRRCELCGDRFPGDRFQDGLLICEFCHDKIVMEEEEQEEEQKAMVVESGK
jgi:hypothetical protein